MINEYLGQIEELLATNPDPKKENEAKEVLLSEFCEPANGSTSPLEKFRIGVEVCVAVCWHIYFGSGLIQP